MARVAPIPTMSGGGSESSGVFNKEEQALPPLPASTEDATQFLSGLVDIVSKQLNTAQLALTAHHNQVLQVIEAAHAEHVAGTNSTGELQRRISVGSSKTHDSMNTSVSLQVPSRHKATPQKESKPAIHADSSTCGGHGIMGTPPHMAVKQEGLRETATANPLQLPSPRRGSTATAPSPRLHPDSPKSNPHQLRFTSETSSQVAMTPVPSGGRDSKHSVSSTASFESDVIALSGDVDFFKNRNGGLRASVHQNILGNKSQESTESPKAHRKSGFFEDMNVSRHCKSVFLDADTMKAHVKEAIMKKEYSVYDLYKEKGICQWIGRSPHFENLSLVVISCNAIYMAIDVDHNDSATMIGSKPTFIAFENFFCFYYAAELIIRFGAFDIKHKCLSDGWFVFDAIMSLMMVLETWVVTFFLAVLGSGFMDSGMENASILKLLRLSRMTRLARLAKVLNATPELLILIKGIGVAARSVFFTLCLLVLLIYVFAVGLKQVTAGFEPLHTKYFETVLVSMNTLLLRGVLPDLADLVNLMGKAHPAFACIMLFFILFSSLTIMNMLVGVLVEVVSVVSAVEKEQMTIKYVKKMILGMLEDDFDDEDQNMMISKEEFKKLLLKPQACRIIQDVGVDVVGLVDFLDFIFQEGRELSFPEFMDVVLQLRGCNNATVRDVVDLRKFVLNQNNETVMAVTRSVNAILAQHGHVLTRKVQWNNNAGGHIELADGAKSDSLSGSYNLRDMPCTASQEPRRIQFVEHTSEGTDSSNCGEPFLSEVTPEAPPGTTQSPSEMSEGTTVAEMKEREALTYCTGPTIGDFNIGDSLSIAVGLLQPCPAPQEPDEKQLVQISDISPPEDGAPAWATRRTSPKQDGCPRSDTMT